MTARNPKSRAAFARAGKVLVGGVNSPVRSFAAVGGTPLFIERGAGARVTDADGNTYIDYVGSYGPLILGHAAEQVVTAVTKAASHGTSFGAPTEAEARLAEAVVAAMPSIEKVRFVNSGTEAVMTAVRLARAATGRDRVVKCIGGYHGHSDGMLVSAGSGAASLGVPSSPGVPAGTTADTLLVPYNDLSAAERVFAEHAGRVAAMLVEPVAGNMGTVPPAPGYLQGLRELCDRHGALLVFDEVITGFRVGPGGAQGLYGVPPDLTVLGKVIGGGMPIGAVGGPARIMKLLAPEGPVYQAGTLSGNPVAAAAGLATLDAVREEGFYQRLDSRSAALADGLLAAADRAGLAARVCLNRVGSMVCLFFTPGPVSDYASAAASNTKAYAAYFHAMLEGGVYLPPSQFETLFVSAAHGEQDVADTLRAAAEAMEAAAGALR